MTQKREVLLTRTDLIGDAVVFGNGIGATVDGSVYLDFLRKDWDEMGRPETVTVTIQPGDRLNTPYDPRRGE